MEAAATTAGSAANNSEEASLLRELATSIRAATTPVVSAGPLMGSQNIVNEEPQAVSSLEPPVELESVRESLHTMGISEEAPKELNQTPDP
jgi:hypothetical protein